MSTDDRNRVHSPVTASTAYEAGGALEASAFSKGDKWTNLWEDKAGRIVERRYVVKDEDTLAAIAETFYGDAEAVAIIRNANDLSGDDEPSSGTELTIPAESD
jgi:nucleoid-associated protein YgaU